MGAKAQSHRPRRIAALVLAIGLVTSGVLTLLTSDVVRRSQRNLLLNESAIAASVLGGLVGQIRSSLDAVGTVVVATGGSRDAFQRLGSLPSMAQYTSLVVLTDTSPNAAPTGSPSGAWVPEISVRPATIALTDSSLPVVRALQNAPMAGIDVLGFVGSGTKRLLAIADRPTGSPHLMVYVEVPLAAPAPSASGSAGSQPLRDLNFAIYFDDTESPADLVFASTNKLPLAGNRAAVRLLANGTTTGALLSSRPGDTAGPPQDILVVLSPKRPLGGALTAGLPWIVLATGVLLSFVAGIGFGLLLSGRNRALDLVDQMQASNEARDRALSQRAEAERQRARLEAQLRQAQRLEAVGQLAGGIAHDFNNLLGVILNFGQFAVKALEGHPAEDDVKEMLRAAEQAVVLTRQLLVFSRKDVVRPEAVKLNDVIEATCRILDRALGEHVELQLHLDPGLPLVEADVGGLEQVLLNLAVNARDAMPDGGRLSIATSLAEIDESHTATHVGAAPGLHVLLEVSDTGCGMTPEVSLQIFEPFFTTKAAGAGTGMGLATVYGIISRWGGHITVYTEPGLGTAFKIWLPVIASAVPDRAPGTAPAGVNGDGGGRRILLVEDEPAVRRAARRILETAGYRVEEVSNGAEALAAFEQVAPELLVTDVVMPGGISGKLLAEKVRERAPRIPVLFMSGYTADIITARGVLDDTVSLIQKPFTADVLLEGVRRALAGSPTANAAHGAASV